jgi:hypothetical protein
LPQANRQKDVGQPNQAGQTDQAGQTYRRALAYLHDQPAAEWT